MNIGIIGGGQLAKMMILAGYPMAQEFVVLDPAEDSAAGQVAKQIVGNYDDPEKLSALAKQVDVVTFDFENVPANAITQLEKQVSVFPNAKALANSQDRLNEKNLFVKLGIPTPAFRQIDSLQDLDTALEALGTPAVLKTRTLGYDGKGQFVIRDKDETNTAWKALNEQPSILEEFVKFDHEASIIAVRSQRGDIAYYPLVHNTHKNGILRLSIAPFEDLMLQAEAEAAVRPILKEFDYVGVLALELFVKNGNLLANEIAPRVHNTGHWTIEGASVSQFENHLRAITGLPLGTTEAHSYAAMINFISKLPPVEEILSIPGCHYHNYGKKPREGRKLGHVTLRASTMEKLQNKIDGIFEIIDDQN